MLIVWVVYWRTSIETKQFKYGDVLNRKVNIVTKDNTIDYWECCFGRDGFGWNKSRGKRRLWNRDVTIQMYSYSTGDFEIKIKRILWEFSFNGTV